MPKATAAPAAPILPAAVAGLKPETILPNDPMLPAGLLIPQPMQGVHLPDGRAFPTDLPLPILAFHFPDLFPPEAPRPTFPDPTEEATPEAEAASEPDPAPTEVTNAEQ